MADPGQLEHRVAALEGLSQRHNETLEGNSHEGLKVRFRVMEEQAGRDHAEIQEALGRIKRIEQECGLCSESARTRKRGGYVSWHDVKLVALVFLGTGMGGGAIKASPELFALVKEVLRAILNL